MIFLLIIFSALGNTKLKFKCQNILRYFCCGFQRKCGKNLKDVGRVQVKTLRKLFKINFECIPHWKPYFCHLNNWPFSCKWISFPRSNWNVIEVMLEVTEVFLSRKIQINFVCTKILKVSILFLSFFLPCCKWKISNFISMNFVLFDNQQF